MRPLLPVLCLLSACTSAPVPRAIADSTDADSGLVLSSSVVEGWQVVETCRPHLCHLHRRLAITAPDRESMVVLIAPDESNGKPAAVAFRSFGWDDCRMPTAVADNVSAWVAASKGGQGR